MNIDKTLEGSESQGSNSDVSSGTYGTKSLKDFSNETQGTMSRPESTQFLK